MLFCKSQTGFAIGQTHRINRSIQRPSNARRSSTTTSLSALSQAFQNPQHPLARLSAADLFDRGSDALAHRVARFRRHDRGPGLRRGAGMSQGEIMRAADPETMTCRLISAMQQPPA